MIRPGGLGSLSTLNQEATREGTYMVEPGELERVSDSRASLAAGPVKLAQLDLLADPAYPDWMTHPRDATERRFVTFHSDNPSLYTMLEGRALWAYSRGGKVGMRCLWENARWSTQVEVQRCGEDWKMNDHFVPCYARLLIHRHPQLRRMIETRGER